MSDKKMVMQTLARVASTPGRGNEKCKGPGVGIVSCV